MMSSRLTSPHKATQDGSKSSVYSFPYEIIIIIIIMK